MPTLPLFVHERLSTKAIIQALQAHEREGVQQTLFDLYGDPHHSIADQCLKAYEHRDPWVNRLILGDSLQVMNSLLHKEKMGGQVQMIYMDPPYGVKYGSNFQPFVRKRDVNHNADDDLTREPEMVQAYRDIWGIGLHSYLTYMRDRLTLARELLHPSGSVFVQISDENLHHARSVLDEVFGAENFSSVISYATTSGVPGLTMPRAGDFLLWYCRDRSQVKYRQPFRPKRGGDDSAAEYKWVMLEDKTTRPLAEEEIAGVRPLPSGSRQFRYGPLTSSGSSPEGSKPFRFAGRDFSPGPNNHWKVTHAGLHSLADAGLLVARSNSLAYYLFLDSYPVVPINNHWPDTKWGFDASTKQYVCQTNAKVVQRCLMMTTDPGDLVVDPNCGAGTTASVAEQWGRRWITIDVSRIPLAIARQRLLTTPFPWYELKDDARGPAGGFVYKRKKNRRGEEVGGLVPHITLGSIAHCEPLKEEVLADRPEITDGVVRVSGPFTFEATIPAVAGPDEPVAATIVTDSRSYHERMIGILRRSPRLALPGNRFISFEKVRTPTKARLIHAEAELVNGSIEPLAVLFGPEHGTISEKAVFDAAKEANGKGYVHLVVIGFAIEAKARHLIDNCEAVCGITATYAAATPDVTMGDLLKNMRSSQILSVCGSPEVELIRLPAAKGQPQRYQVKLLGVDVFDPITMDVHHRKGDDVPAWFLCHDYDDLVFRISQAFFPRTGAWDNLKRSLRGNFDDSLWAHLAGTVSAPFEAGPNQQVAVKVIDDRGNELLVVKKLDEALAPAPKPLVQPSASRDTAKRGKKR